MPPPLTQREVALAYIASFEHLDGDGNIALRTPDCTQTILPTSLGYKPDMTNEEWTAHFSSLQKNLTAFPVTPVEVLESGNQVTIWATGRALFRTMERSQTSAEEWPEFFENEYIFIFVFDSSGRKISRILEMVDSGKVERVRPFLKKMRGMTTKE